MKMLPLSLSLFLALVTLSSAPAAEGNPLDVPPEIKTESFLFEVVGHLYRWYMDEIDVVRGTEAQNTTLWVRSLYPALDEGDRSQYAEILLPAVGMAAKIKRADYSIPEIGAVVKSERFKIVQVQKMQLPENPEASYVPVKMAPDRLKEYLFVNRNKASYPEGDLLTRMRLAARNQMREDNRMDEEDLPEDTGVVHFAPISPVANEVFIFWEAGRLLIHFASDLDLENPAVWEYEDLAVNLIDIDQQTVVSFDEVAGSNAYYTRDQIGRALFNCIILGKRVELNRKDMEAIEAATP